MRPTHIQFVCLLAIAAPSSAQIAPIVNNNPAGATYVAVLPDKNDTTVRGTIQVGSSSNGTGVNVQISITGLVVAGGPYAYHIHQGQAPALNCPAAGDHLDPYNAGTMPCDPTQPDKCQVGDLSGKHGNMTGPSFTANYLDLYLSTQPDSPAFFGNRSLVVHFGNGTSVSCANFSMPAPVATAQGPVLNVQSSSTPCTTSTSASSSSTPCTTSMSVQATSTSCTTSTSAVGVTVTQTQITTAGATTTIATISSAPVSSNMSSTVASTPQVASLTTTVTLTSMVVVVPPHTSLQTVADNVTVVQSSNITLISSVQQPYTITGISTVVATVVQPSSQTVTVPTSIVETSILSGYTQGTMATAIAAPANVQTVYATALSTVTLSPGATMPSAYTITASSAATSPTTDGALTITSTSGNLISTVSSYLFGGATTTVTVPTTVVLTTGQPLVPSVVSQIIQVASISAVPGVADVVNIVSAPVAGATSIVGDVLTQVTMLPSVITNVVSVVTVGGIVDTLTSDVFSLVGLGAAPLLKAISTDARQTKADSDLPALTTAITSTNTINIAIPIATTAVAQSGGSTTGTTATVTTVVTAGVPSGKHAEEKAVLVSFMLALISSVFFLL